ncbi:MAG: KEOPS complex subunit Pcc1 [Candidatus Bathyarchaeia archaeon]
MIRVTIRFKVNDPHVARSLVKSMEPDNLSAPPSVRIRAAIRGGHVVTCMECSKGLETLIATVDDLLVCLDAAYKTLVVVKDEERA